MDPVNARFDWPEYSVFCVMLGVSATIGIYFGLIKGGQDTISGYLLGGKQMSIFPIAMSLVSTYISGITLLGVPTEIYTYGIQYLLTNVANIICGFLTAYIILPVFYKLQYISLFEYMEARFGPKVRKITSLLYTISTLTYIPIVIYGPALALNQVSGVSIHAVSPIISAVCIFYTTLGGLKAVVWSDAIQGAVMMGSVLTVICLGTIRVGGLGAIFKYAEEGERLEILNMDPDPTARLTFWSSIIGITFWWFSHFAFSPASVQRFISLPTYGKAQISVVCLVIGVALFVSLSGFIGLIMYAEFKGCDPLASGIIQRPDQILPHFVLLVSHKVRGLSGLFLAGIVCAALSSMSTCLNTLAGTFYEDFIEPLLPNKLSEKKASLVIKFLVVVFGIKSIFLVTIIEKLGALLEISAGFGGVTAGTTLGLFLLGLLFPWANNYGALTGAIAGLISMSGVLVGSTIARTQGLLYFPTKPLSVENCTFYEPPTMNTINNDLTSSTFILFRISPFYYSMVGCLLVIFVGLVVSFLTGPTNLMKINRDLICPVVHWVLPKKTIYNSVPTNESKDKKNNVIKY